jgi:hypothetical protein
MPSPDFGREADALLAHAVKEEKAADPEDVRFLGAAAVVPRLDRLPDAVEEARRPRGGGREWFSECRCVVHDLPPGRIPQTRHRRYRTHLPG